MPIVGAAMVMFFMAALIEGFLSPSGAPYPLKVLVALLSSGLLAVYFIVLGFPSEIKTPQASSLKPQAFSPEARAPNL
jgi:hypothetical protein